MSEESRAPDLVALNRQAIEAVGRIEQIRPFADVGEARAAAARLAEERG